MPRQNFFSLSNLTGTTLDLEINTNSAFSIYFGTGLVSATVTIQFELENNVWKTVNDRDGNALTITPVADQFSLIEAELAYLLPNKIRLLFASSETDLEIKIRTTEF